MADDTNEGTAPDEGAGPSRRRLLALLGGGTLLAGGAYAGTELLDGGTEGPASTTTETATRIPTSNRTGTDAPTTDRARRLAERYAPDLYFGVRERWFPTDPRPYTSTDEEGRTVVDGFDALDGYTAAFDGDPPSPTAFYNIVDVSERLVVVQFWFYSVFDQFSVNFHWHDWELLQTFVDVESGEPVLHCASAHSRKIPNNEFVDPVPGPRASIISEVGSHSSALGVNREPASFQRFPTGDLIADITNRAVAIGNLVEEIPLAYGLPRDEGFSLPYAVPELDGAPLYDHADLPNVAREDFVDEDVTVRRLDALTSPPSLPQRETGLQFSATDEGDYRYDLVPMAEVADIEAYVGPQLSFEFGVPSFAEDAVASHITTAGVPRTQGRYDDPVADVTDPRHRATLAERYPAVDGGGAVSRLVGAVREVVPNPDAPDGAGVAFAGPTTEAVALLESEGTGVPTTNGLLFVEDVPPGEHRLTVNGAGVAPYAETFSHGEDDEQRVVGTDGRVAVVPNDDAVKLRADASDGAGVAAVRVDDDYGGAVYDATPPGEDRFGVYVHRGGAYTVSVIDRDGNVGVFRANPNPDDDAVTIENPVAGKRSRIRYLLDLLEESLARVTELRERGDVDGNALEAVDEQLRRALAAAESAAEFAEAGDAAAADESLAVVDERLAAIDAIVEERADRLPETVHERFVRRQRRLREATEAARAASLSTADSTETTERPTATGTATATERPTATGTATATDRPTATETETEDRDG
jgi:hypothetical protein